MKFLRFDHEDYMKWIKTQKRPLLLGESCFWFDEQYSIDKNIAPEQVYFTAPTATIHPATRKQVEMAKRMFGDKND